MDTHTLTVLEFGKILNFLKQYVTSPQGSSLCERLTPLTNLREIKTLLSEVTEMKEVLNTYDDIPIHGIRDIEEFLNRTSVEGSYLEPQQLQEICSTLETGRKVKTFFRAIGTKYSSLQNIIGKIIPLKELEDAIKGAIGNQGEILDTASQELKALRQQIKNIKFNIKDTLDELLFREDLSFIFQEQLITIRNGRFVLPVKIDHKGYLSGVVHDQSHSKATYFIEPLSVVNLNNELQILRKEEIHEEIRVLTNLTAQTSEKKPEMLFTLSLLEQLDLIYAKAKLSTALNACEPILNEEGYIKLNSCKHPILLAHLEPLLTSPNSPEKESEGDAEELRRWIFDASKVVPINLYMDKEINTLIITGANAGGKTVTLKTLGILSLMAQTGMHIPAGEESTLTVFHSIFADIGDEQNIEESLSTFSAHISRLDQILRDADEKSLVLLDELGSGTDPSEGGALGLAILDHLKSKNSSIVITSHLTLFKTYAYSHKDVENVSVEFDPVTLKPTYNLVYGMPGLSNALAIARNLGMSDDILRSAGKYLEEKDKQLLELIKGLEQSQKEIAQKKNKIIELREGVSVHEKSVESLLKTIKSKKVKILSDYENKFKRYLREAETKLEKIVNEAKKKGHPLAKKSNKTLREVKEELRSHIPLSPEEGKPIESLKVGQAVKLLHFNQEGVVLKVDPTLKKAEILVGEKKVKTHFKAITHIKDKEQGEEKSTPTEKHSPAKNHYSASFLAEEVSPKINVIGMTADEALPIVDRTIDHALIKGLERIEIIHGLGTGRLKAAIRKHLKNHSYVKSFWSDDQSRGGAGVTQVDIQFHPKGTTPKKSHKLG
ncbi:MAG: endonuclease MutS2 [Deltaproteobacteria bacterium]|nr:endonuclease MutS2 [Deltaproteobacteria bacterium]